MLVKPGKSISWSRFEWFDLIWQVSRFLQTEDLLTLAQVSQRFRLGENDIWKIRWMDRFKEMFDSPPFQELLLSKGKPMKSGELYISNWKRYFSVFELCWIDFVIAGFDTEQRCLVGVHGVVYDVTGFLDAHPGSKETVLMQGGMDATAFFEDVCHSSAARSLMKDFSLLAPNERVRPCILLSAAQSHLGSKAWIEQASEGGASVQSMWGEIFTKVVDGGYGLLSASPPTAVCHEHTGTVRPFYDPTEGRWYSWRSCCKEVESYEGL